MTPLADVTSGSDPGPMPTGGTEAVLVLYAESLRVRNLRPGTRYGRERALARLTRWADDGPILYLTEADLMRWQTERSRSICAGSLRGEMTNIHAFYLWAVRQRYLAVDPMVRLDMPRTPRRFPRPIADRKLAAALADADQQMSAILGLAAFAGFRACEIAGLEWPDVGLADPVPQLRICEGKGGRGRVVPLSPVLAELLLALPGPHRGPVIPRLDGQAGANRPHTISHRANDYLHGMGIPDTLHTARHRFATVAFRHCRDLRAVQDLLGHASPTTTSIYTLSSPGVAIQAVTDAGTLTA